MNQKIDPFLWFEKDAEAAVDFYMSVFDDAAITRKTHYQEGWPGPVGQVMTIEFTIAGQRFVALNGGAEPGFTFTSGISFVVNCDTQEEMLSDGDPERADRVMQAMLVMTKLEIKPLEDAYHQP